MREAFASIEQLRAVHVLAPGAAIISRCRETMIDFARVIEEWALRYEISSLDEYPSGGDRSILRAKAAALREDMPRMIEQVLEGKDIPPRDLLEQLEDLLEDTE